MPQILQIITLKKEYEKNKRRKVDRPLFKPFLSEKLQILRFLNYDYLSNFVFVIKSVTSLLLKSK